MLVINRHVGLENPGIEHFAEEDLPWLKQFGTPIILNVGASSLDEYVEVCRVANKLDIDAVELNLSCPNVCAGCMAFGVSYEGVKETTSAVRKVLDKPLIVKLTPNVTDITFPAKGAEDAGADAVSAINTVLAMKIDVKKRKPILANNTGGLSGPAIKPIGVMVYQIAQKIKIPVMGLGGIMTGEDAVEYMLAGAKCVSIGCGNFIDPATSLNVIEQIEEYMKENKVEDINEIIGGVTMN